MIICCSPNWINSQTKEYECRKHNMSIVWLNMISVGHECLLILPTGYHTQIMCPNLHTKLLCSNSDKVTGGWWSLVSQQLKKSESMVSLRPDGRRIVQDIARCISSQRPLVDRSECQGNNTCREQSSRFVCYKLFACLFVCYQLPPYPS